MVWVDNENGIQVGLETALTPELIEEGRLADIKRRIQQDRKSLGLSVGEEIDQYFFSPYDDTDRTAALRFEEEIRKHCKVKELIIL